MAEYQIFVITLTGKCVPFMVTPDETVLSLKQKIFSKEGVQVCQQRLIFQGKRFIERLLIS
jgi:hypothetical protein